MKQVCSLPRYIERPGNETIVSGRLAERLVDSNFEEYDKLFWPQTLLLVCYMDVGSKHKLRSYMVFRFYELSVTVAEKACDA